MEYKKFGNKIVIRIDRGEEILSALREACERENVKLASVSALGAVNRFTVGVFKTAEKKYVANTFTGEFEIVSLTGTVTTLNDGFYAHLHMSAGDGEGKVFGGHLNEGYVSATCEMLLDLIDGSVEREFNGEIGLNLMKF